MARMHAPTAHARAALCVRWPRWHTLQSDTCNIERPTCRCAANRPWECCWSSSSCYCRPSMYFLAAQISPAPLTASAFVPPASTCLELRSASNARPASSLNWQGRRARLPVSTAWPARTRRLELRSAPTARPARTQWRELRSVLSA